MKTRRLVMWAVITACGFLGESGGVRAEGPTRTLFTPDACSQCHSAGALRAPSVFGGGDNAPRLVRFDEFNTWERADKHRRAFHALTNPRARSMARRLKVADVSRERSCLACHSTGFTAEDPAPEVSAAFDTRAQGVGCTACHGPYKEWVQTHGLSGSQLQNWRGLTQAEKRRDYGMTNLRDPATRAQLCLSCHLGSPTEGKLITHDMYAAGHPPLPGIEVAAFSEAMPPHWWKPEEVPLFQGHPEIRSRYAGDASPAKLSLVGGLMSLREAVKLLQYDAGRGMDRDRADAWPDYARMDCYACHHELRTPGHKRWRQRRANTVSFDGMSTKLAAGHPRARLWSLPLVEALLAGSPGWGKQAEVRIELRESVHALLRAYSGGQFGDPEEVLAAARRVELAADRLLERIKATTFDDRMAAKSLDFLSGRLAEDSLDYDQTRVAVWAIGSLRAGRSPLGPEADRMASIRDKMNTAIKLDPFGSRAEWSRVAGDRTRPEALLVADLFRLSESEYPASLARAAEFDPDDFRPVAREFRDLLGRINGVGD